MANRAKRIAVIGTGIMGGPMAGRLADAGYPVTVWNRTRDKADALSCHGIGTAATAAEAATGADVVIVMLSSGPVCEDVLLGSGGAVAAMKSGAALVVMSSIPVETAVLIGERATGRGLAYSDAPVSGGEKGAREGTLAIMAGGTAADVAALSDVFACLGRVTHVGPAGSGALTKLANQLIVASTICAVAEALTLAERGGADPARVREALLGGFADSTVFRQHGLKMVTGDFRPGGPAKYQVKDTSTALAFAQSCGLRLPVGEEVDRLYQAMVDNGDGDLDHSGIILELRRMNETAKPTACA
ncbi:NAD(P)-dependent oxidoreductase [Sinorhizobium meliloti]|uniref:NAD(P)-dependent oxidoreductase n=1 Tax=Rhizobium meliloti TaxID=382 RepID=UPI000FD55401|nr:NAD(P)-dependent oxidoreductase [Sinorhizobium meliloti]MQV32712.1 NAD-binding protein [Sinorhizobium meliloti]RVE85643.1 NAD(P)-dependent oxidoreductase [Sinorhizobium meliloti]RVG49016.1 NAD(P)-dependent oxidoreductase [Sinorhizobium meliloti]RVM03840.1 NAD(P)-dependent oxidoreductase [Sinorhizobium meliloti]RVM42538.1 NAD(P)-dependent oxidoreductase [Sinorhizobium meliloti]